MKWVTRERPKIDRIACPWLVARFIDPDAEFVHVPASDLCSFDAFCDGTSRPTRPCSNSPSLCATPTTHGSIPHHNTRGCWRNQ